MSRKDKTNYRVEVDGDTVWSEDFDTESAGSHKLFPVEYLRRPAEPANEGDPHPSPRYLYIGDELVGIQRCHADEAEQLDAAVEVERAAGNHELADAYVREAADARGWSTVVRSQQARAAEEA